MAIKVVDADQQYRCPRCGQDVQERFYGPCTACRQELASTQGTDTDGGADRVEAERFEPSMNVVPNQVATKE
jgi:DNA-directed RNA polymerase subunit RPC12/RpoP